MNRPEQTSTQKFIKELTIQEFLLLPNDIWIEMIIIKSKKTIDEDGKHIRR